MENVESKIYCDCAECAELATMRQEHTILKHEKLELLGKVEELKRKLIEMEVQYAKLAREIGQRGRAHLRFR